MKVKERTRMNPLKEPDGFRWEVGCLVRGRKIKGGGVSALSCPPKIAPVVSTLRD